MNTLQHYIWVNVCVCVCVYIPQYIGIIQTHLTLMAETEEELKNLLMRVKEENEKAALKLNIKNKNKKKQLRSCLLAQLLHNK